MSLPHNHAVQTSRGICHRCWWLQNQSAIVLQQIRFNNPPASGLQRGSKWKKKETKRLLLPGHFLVHRLPASQLSNLEMGAFKVSTHWGFQRAKAGDSGQGRWQPDQLLCTPPGSRKTLVGVRSTDIIPLVPHHCAELPEPHNLRSSSFPHNKQKVLESQRGS